MNEGKPARQRISSPDQPESPPFQYNIRLEILAEQIRAGKSVSMKDTLEVDYYLEQKQKALAATKPGQWFAKFIRDNSTLYFGQTKGELALEIIAWICALGILGLVLWGLVT